MFDLNPEQAVIGIALNDRKALDDLDLLGPEDFRDERYGELWGLIRSRHQSGKPHDVTSMVAVSRVRDLTAADIQAMAIGAPMGASASHYGALVAAQAQQDRLVAVGTRIIQEAQEAALADMTEVAEAARAAVDEASGADLAQSGIRAGDYFDPFMAEVGTSAVKRIPSPWPDLDHLTGGFRPGAVYVIGARPAAGKSVFGLQIADALSRNDNGKVLFSSLEMTRDEIMPRLIAQTCSVPLKAFEPGGMTERYRAMIDAHADKLRASDVVFDDRATITPALVRSYASTVSRRGHLSGIVVDYLQLMQAAKSSRKSRQEIVSDYSRALKMLAKEMNVPVIVLSQLNRNSAQPGAQPTIADLRESGAIEQDADVIMLLHRDDDAHPGSVFVGVGKNRHGPTGTFELAFQGGYSRADTMGSAWSD